MKSAPPVPVAHLAQVFSSIQGEGPWVGSRTLFVRFAGCSLRCAWCDEPEALGRAAVCRVEHTAGRGDYREIPNPVSSPQLNRLLAGLVRRGGRHPFLSLTGGEPLEQHEFLQGWLPSLRRKFRIYLETGGVLPKSLKQVLPWVDVVSMDMKLPSSAKTGEFWDEHLEFLRAASHKEAYVKVVVTADTERLEVLKCALLTRRVDPAIPFVIQPVTPFGAVREAPEAPLLVDLQRECLRLLKDVRVIPQIHKPLGLR